MNTTEFRKLVSETKNTDWFKNQEITLRFPSTNSHFNLKGLGNLYKFWHNQENGWENLKENLPNEFLNVLKHFQNYEQRIIEFVRQNLDQEIDGHLDNSFRNLKSQLENSNPDVFPFDSPETQFLLEVHKNAPQSFPAAYEYIRGQINRSANNKDNLIGFLLAYEFAQKDHTEITQRRDKEKASLTRLRNELEIYNSELENQLTDQLKKSTEDYDKYVQSLDTFKSEKEKSYSDWFISVKGYFENFSKASEDKINELEETYRAKLKLEEPAKYWSDRGKSLKIQGWVALGVLVVLVLIIVWSLAELLWKTPEQLYSSFFNGDKSAAIRWSIIYITFLSFMIFTIKAISKVMFSSFHLARDSEERHTLTYFYLSLLKDSKVDEKDKQLIMQALFSRAETGLLKEDSSPSMPNDLASKFFNK